MFIQSRKVSYQNHNVPTSGGSGLAVVRKSHLKMIWAFKVIQGHPHWCQQKSTAGCCRNVQQCLSYFRNLQRHSIGTTANSSISTTPPSLTTVI